MTIRTVSLLTLVLLLSGAAASAVEPCCGITHVNARTGVVTVADHDTGRTFQFQAPTSRLRSLKIGQAVNVDYRARKASVEGMRDLFAIVNVRPAEPVGDPADPAEPVGDEMRPAEPVGELMKPAEPVGEPTASGQAMTAAGSGDPLGTTKPGRPPMKIGRGTENPGRNECAARGGEWRCTTVSTGSSPGPEDDVISCVCINP